MRIFVCYASEDHLIAESVCLSLRGIGHQVFLDRTSLPAGDTYDLQILEAIDESDLMIVLVSPEAIAPGAYTLTEIGFAQRKWPHPARRVLPVIARPTEIGKLPPYLRSVSVLCPRGDLVAETTAAVSALRNPWARNRRRVGLAIVAVAVSIGLGGIAYQNLLWRQHGCAVSRENAGDAGRRALESIDGARRETETIRAEYIPSAQDALSRYDKEWRCDERYVPQVNGAFRDLSEAINRVENRCSIKIALDATVRAQLEPLKHACGLHPSDYAEMTGAIQKAIGAVNGRASW